jgi:SAM-dependent methyltransferase
MLELALEDLGWRGRLVGTDIHKPSIDWAQRRIGSRIPSWEFVHCDIYNGAYWRRGTLTAREWLSAFDRRGFDIVVAKSFFTHLLPDELETYLEAIADRMKPGGRALLTFFLLHEEQRRLAEAGQNRITFHQAGTDPRYRVRTPIAPTAAVAYEKEYLLDRMEDNGLWVAEDSIHYGVWTGYAQGLSFQDIVLATK